MASNQSTSNGKSSNATTAASNSSSSLSKHAIFYMVLLAFQFGMQPILTRKYTSSDTIRSTVIIVQEVIKFVIAGSMLVLSKQTSNALEGFTIYSWITVAVLPATLYTCQNLAALVAYQNLDALTFNVLNQTKTLSAALCCYLVMGRTQSTKQVIALFMLLSSALIMEKVISFQSLSFIINNGNTNDAQANTTTTSAKHYTHGVAPIMLASFISGLAGALTQKNLQSVNNNKSSSGSSSNSEKTASANPYFFSMQLCVASVIFLLGSMIFSADGQNVKSKGFWYGWTNYTFVPIITNASGGIVVGLVTKYAGSVRKGFALIFGIFLSGIVQEILQPENGITKEQITGGLLAAISLYLHATNPPTTKTTAARIQENATSSKKEN